jgi:hypothetical protein
MMEEIEHHGMAMPLFVTEVAYSIIQITSVDSGQTPTQELDSVL